MTKNEFYQRYMTHLNKQQVRAVESVEGATLLLAVPGSGKTTVLVTRLGYMILCHQIPPEKILTLTYTVAATRDMSERFYELFGEACSSRVEFRTINGICAKIIAAYGRMIGKEAFELVTEERVIIKLLSELYLQTIREYPTESDIKTIRTYITYCKNMLMSLEEIELLGKQEGIPLREIYESYNQELRKRGQMDYDDQMIYAYRMLKGSKELLGQFQEMYQYVCVDEAQDTSKIQHMIIDLLVGKQGKLFMVGDEDQSIYGFRAAYPEALLHFEENHPGGKVLVMDKNYRSLEGIVSLADRFIQKNILRHKKHMVATREAFTGETVLQHKEEHSGEGKNQAADVGVSVISLKTRADQYKYLLQIASNIPKQQSREAQASIAAGKTDTAVLYRDNESILPLIDMLERNQVPYRMKSMDMTFFSHRIVLDVIAMLRFALDPADSESFLHIYYKIQTYLRKNQALELVDVAAFENMNIFDAVDEVSSINGMTRKNCRSMGTHFRNMLSETPYRALGRIERFMGYGEYLERNGLNDNKLFILKQLALGERTIVGFLERLSTLQELISHKNERPQEKSSLILSTIHSSKGLEYTRVYIIDAVNGVFPSEVDGALKIASEQEKKLFEEERRLFYVAMTRAKEKLFLFDYENESSIFLKECELGRYRRRSSGDKATQSISRGVRGTGTYSSESKRLSRNIKPPEELVIGQRVKQKKYGIGIISDVSYTQNGRMESFQVAFENEEEKTFMYPHAFLAGAMELF